MVPPDVLSPAGQDEQISSLPNYNNHYYTNYQTSSINNITPNTISKFTHYQTITKYPNASVFTILNGSRLNL